MCTGCRPVLAMNAGGSGQLRQARTDGFHTRWQHGHSQPVCAVRSGRMCAILSLSRPACPVASTGTRGCLPPEGELHLNYITRRGRVIRMPRARNGDECPQHRYPLGECPPSSRHGHTIRARDDDWRGAQDANGHKDIADWIAVAMETRLGHVRCPRCDNRNPDSPPVPLICGDLAGGTLDSWIGVAEKRAMAQHPCHEPVWLGTEPAAPAPVVNMPPVPAAVPDHGGKKGRTAGDRLPR